MNDRCRLALAMLGLLWPFTAAAATFDYYVLALTWMPEFCAMPRQGRQPECQGGDTAGFRAHGLWPQSTGPGQPEYCRPAPALPGDLADSLGPGLPGPSLARHEWRRHGSCSGLNATQYFEALRRATASVRIPERLGRGQAAEAPARSVKAWFVEANPDLPPDAIRLICARGEREIVEIRICLDKGLKFRDCAPEPRDRCPAGQVRFRIP